MGCLCFNLDLTKFDLAAAAPGELTTRCDADALLSPEGEAGAGGETFAETVEEMLAQLVGQVLERAGKPAPMMDRDDKIRVVQQLDRRGAFLVRGAVEYVAGMLGVSRVHHLLVPGGVPGAQGHVVPQVTATRDAAREVRVAKEGNPAMASFVTHLECARCGAVYDAGREQHLCSCGGPLLVRYDLARVKQAVSKEQLAAREGSLWRYREFLPVEGASAIVSMGEAWTPVLSLARWSSRRGFPAFT